MTERAQEVLNPYVSAPHTVMRTEGRAKARDTDTAASEWELRRSLGTCLETLL